ncbi:MAG: hypothetical protein NC340_02345 [Ruminococcus flavefaciens]|nr:hypothetical protein [Ruminococcus flavefaciens]MCM1229313.1 hypothetical protein [Ruminococcus flavefaciens]
MNKGIKKLLVLSSKLSQELAVRSCSVVSTFDSYQPVRPEAVAKTAKSRKSK